MADPDKKHKEEVTAAKQALTKTVEVANQNSSGWAASNTWGAGGNKAK